MSTKTAKSILSGQDRLKEASKDFQKLMEEVNPYVKKSDVIIIQTADKWHDLSATIIANHKQICKSA